MVFSPFLGFLDNSPLLIWGLPTMVLGPSIIINDPVLIPGSSCCYLEQQYLFISSVDLLDLPGIDLVSWSQLGHLTRPEGLVGHAHRRLGNRNTNCNVRTSPINREK